MVVQFSTKHLAADACWVDRNIRNNDIKEQQKNVFLKNEILQNDGKHLEIILSVGLQSLRIELQILKV